jgi:hypothetical protein
MVGRELCRALINAQRRLHPQARLQSSEASPCQFLRHLRPFAGKSFRISKLQHPSSREDPNSNLQSGPGRTEIRSIRQRQRRDPKPAWGSAPWSRSKNRTRAESPPHILHERHHDFHLQLNSVGRAVPPRAAACNQRPEQQARACTPLNEMGRSSVPFACFCLNPLHLGQRFERLGHRSGRVTITDALPDSNNELKDGASSSGGEKAGA